MGGNYFDKLNAERIASQMVKRLEKFGYDVKVNKKPAAWTFCFPSNFSCWFATPGADENGSGTGWNNYTPEIAGGVRSSSHWRFFRAPRAVWPGRCYEPKIVAQSTWNRLLCPRGLADWRGKKRATLAVAHCQLQQVYHLLLNQCHHRELTAAHFDRLESQRQAKYFITKLEHLGYEGVPRPSRVGYFRNRCVLSHGEDVISERHPLVSKSLLNYRMPPQTSGFTLR